MATMGWREKDGFPAAIVVTQDHPQQEGVPVIAAVSAPPVIQGIVVAQGPEFIALWFNSATRSVSRAAVIAWRISGPQAWPCTLLSVEPTFLKRPDGVVFDITTGDRWDNEGDWLAAQP